MRRGTDVVCAACAQHEAFKVSTWYHTGGRHDGSTFDLRKKLARKAMPLMNNTTPDSLQY